MSGRARRRQNGGRRRRGIRRIDILSIAGFAQRMPFEKSPLPIGVNSGRYPRREVNA